MSGMTEESKLTFGGREPLPLRGEWCCKDYEYVATWEEWSAGLYRKKTWLFNPDNSNNAKDLRGMVAKLPTLTVRCSRCGQAHW